MCVDASPPPPDPLIGQASKAAVDLAMKTEERVARESEANQRRLDRIEPELMQMYREQSAMSATNRNIADANQRRVEGMAWPLERTLAADAMGYYGANEETAGAIEAAMRASALQSFGFEDRRAALSDARARGGDAGRDYDAELAALDAEYAKFSGQLDNEIGAMRLYKNAELAGREAAARDAAMAIKSQFANANRGTRMELARAGVSPDSGLYAGLASEREGMEAAASAAAMNAARTAAKQLGWSKRMDAAGLARGWSGNQATNTGLALSSGNAAVNTGLTPINTANAISASANQGVSTALGGFSAGGNLALGGYNAKVNAWSAGNQAKAAEMAGYGQLAGSAIGAWAGKGG